MNTFGSTAAPRTCSCSSHTTDETSMNLERASAAAARRLRCRNRSGSLFISTNSGLASETERCQGVGQGLGNGSVARKWRMENAELGIR